MLFDIPVYMYLIDLPYAPRKLIWHQQNMSIFIHLAPGGLVTRQDGPENETYQGHRSGPTSPGGPRFPTFSQLAGDWLK